MSIVEIFKFPMSVPDSVAGQVLLHRAASAGEVFGPSSSLHSHLSHERTFNSEIDLDKQSYNWGFSLIVVVVLAILYYTATRFLRELIVAIKNSVSLEKCIKLLENRSVNYVRLIKHSVLLMAMGWVLLVFYYLNYFGVRGGADGLLALPWWGVYLSVFVIFLLIWSHQAVLTIACKWVGGWSNFYSILAYVGQFTAVMFSFVALPIMVGMMLLGLHPWWPFSVVILLYVFHFVRVSKHFIVNGFAPLQCFLYLCTVEILPFGTIWLLNR